MTPDAVFAYNQPIPLSLQARFDGRESIPMYHITKIGHVAYQSTVSADTLRAYGLVVPKETKGE